jgi:hypothetical protein
MYSESPEKSRGMTLDQRMPRKIIARVGPASHFYETFVTLAKRAAGIVGLLPKGAGGYRAQ